jgi:aspartate/tyrosine/aromatic aminotransferase
MEIISTMMDKTSTLFEGLDPAPPDAILGLTEAFSKDPNAAKINLTVGVYKDSHGKTPILSCVKQAEERILRDEQSKGYLPMTGSADFDARVQQLLFGEGHEVIASARAVTAQTPGGTGALRVSGDFIHTMFPSAKIWLSEPTWPNHPAVFRAAGLEIATFPYFQTETNSLDFDAMLSALRQVPAGDIVLLHGCCHNPTGIDPTPEQWQQIADTVYEQGALPLLDFAYQGFADGLEEDAVGLRALCREGREMLVCSSYSKNFGLYNERVGALTLVASGADEAATALSHLKLRIRTNYSNPPAHGAAIVATILADNELCAEWEAEVAAMRDRINRMRTAFVKTLADKGVDRDFSFIERQRGMFSFSGLNRDQVDTLRENYSIYVVGSGRINVAAMTEGNIDALCSAIAEVLA